MLTLFTYVYSRARRRAGLPRKRISRARQRWYAVLRYIDSVSIVGGLFGLTVVIVHSDFVFILLPTGISIAVALILARSYLANVKALFFTTIVALAFFAGVTGFELLTHNTTTSKTVLVTTTLAVAIMFSPLAIGSLRLLDLRFHLRDDAISRTVDAFTATLREEIDLDQVRERFFEVIQQTLQPRFVSLWTLAHTQDASAGRPPDAPTPAPPGASTEAGVAGSSPAFSSEQARFGRNPAPTTASTVTIAGDDPIVAYVLKHSGVVDIERLQLDSPLVRTLKAKGAELALPLVSQGELMSVLALGPRMDGLEYTRDNRSLLAMLAAQVAPALRVGQMVRAQQAQVRERERIEQELRTARVIQQTFLPKVVPTLAGWQIATCYQPAREVGGDFYDFVSFEDGRLGIIVGDVTDKGIPAALVMTATRTMLRTASQQESYPGEIFARVNDLLSADIPPGMFVTCFYAILDPASGRLRFANAGQDLPYLRHAGGDICELHATGMPLGLMPGSRYDEGEITLMRGDNLLFYSDGLVEAHNPQHEMFGLPRVERVVAESAGAGGPSLIDAALDALKTFTGAGWEQEDDVTVVTLSRLESDDGLMDSNTSTPESATGDTDDKGTTTEAWRTLDEWTVASEPGNERQAITRMEEAVRALHLVPERLERLKTAVGEATMNAMEHGNGYVPERPVALVVRASGSVVSVLITDEGGQGQDGREAIPTAPEMPDLEAKLAGMQSPRGWGLFLIKEMVDEMRITSDETHHTIELRMALDGATRE